MKRITSSVRQDSIFSTGLDRNAELRLFVYKNARRKPTPFAQTNETHVVWAK